MTDMQPTMLEGRAMPEGAPDAPGDGVSLVIPAYNEGAGIGPTLEAARAMFVRAGIRDYEIVVVDDGSRDDTGAVAAQHGARVVRHPHNAGYGRSLKDGIEAARFDTIAISDADGTYPLDRIPELLEEYRRHFDMVVGRRMGDHLNDTAVKGWLRSVLRWLVEYTTGREVPDVNSGLRIFSRTTIIKYFPHLCDTFSFTTSATLAYMMTGRFVRYVPVAYHSRIGQSHVRLARESMRTLQFIVQAIGYYDPLKLFILMALFCLGIAAISLCFGFLFQIFSGFVLAVGAILVALIVFSLGILADLLKQIMSSESRISRKGPQ